MAANNCVRILIGTAALLLILNFLNSDTQYYTTKTAPAAEPPKPVELHGAAAAAAAEVQRKRRIEDLEQELKSLKSPDAARLQLSSTALSQQPQQQPLPQTTVAAAAASPIEVHMPPPPPPFVAEVVPLAERVDVPAGESLPDALRAMRKGTDLFISFASANMGTRGAVERASMAHAAHSTQPPLTSGVRCACAQRRLRSTGWRICARRVSA